VQLDLLERFRRGDREAFLSVYDQHQASIARLVRRFFAGPFEGEEATQEVWMLVLRMAGSFNPDRGALLSWLRTVAANRCREILRAGSRRPDAREEVPDLEAVPETSDPDRLLRMDRLRAALARFSTGLTPQEALVLKLSLLEERSHAEVAAASGATVRQCKYLRRKLLIAAATHPGLRIALEEIAS